MQHHDIHYRQLFSHPELVRALLRSVLPQAWQALVDLSAMRPLPADLTGNHGQARQADTLWQLQRRDGKHAYLLLLLEHQSRNDRLMAVRLIGYTALVYESLVRRKRVEGRQPLPALLPMVLYSGLRRWRQPTRLADLLDPVPAELQPYQPALQYLVVDQGALVQAGGLPGDNLATLLFQLEHNQGLEHAAALLHTLSELTRHPRHRELRQALGNWVRHILLPRAWPRHLPLPDAQDLSEITRMTVAHSRDWTLRYRMEGHSEILSMLLTRKFGTLPPPVQARLESASDKQLKAWSLALLDAQRLDEVFGD